jgi:hypothetical protein
MSHTQLTLEQRCRLAENCLPAAPFRTLLVALHNGESFCIVGTMGDVRWHRKLALPAAGVAA